MTDDLTIPALDRRGGRALTDFKPEEAKVNITKAEAMIEVAAAMKDWELLADAVDWMIERQRETVAWWGKSVGYKPGPGRGKKDAQTGATFLVPDAERLIGFRHQQISKWKKLLVASEKYREQLRDVARRKAMAERGSTHQRGASGTGENDWHTPGKYLDAARSVLGFFDLDPASSKAAQKRVKAKTFFTPEQDGLAQDWFGGVWLNPPYAQPLIAQFVSKMVLERKAGRVSAAIMLTHNYTDTAWFNEAAGAADAICFMRGRVPFINANGEIAAPTQGQAFFYFGGSIPRFWQAFREIGHVWLPYRGG